VSRQPNQPRFSNPSWQVADRGWLVYQVGADSLDAHCGCCTHKDKKNPCRLNRSLLGTKNNVHKGRPIGLLIAWLFSERATRIDHGNMVKLKHQTKADMKSLSHETRAKAREWASTNGLGVLFTYERPRRVDAAGLFWNQRSHLVSLDHITPVCLEKACVSSAQLLRRGYIRPSP
jgi:hypothetical protein